MGASMVVVRWLLVVEALGLASWPICMRLFPTLPDGGLGVARLLGILLLGYAAWLPASLGLFPLDGPSVASFFILFLVSSAVLAWRGRDEIAPFIAGRKGILVFEEMFFLAVFAAAVFIQSFKPDITLAEKQPDMMYFHSVLRGGAMPPQDLWFAGKPINYYYLGYVLFSCLSRLGLARPEVGFNLSVATVVPLAALGAFSLAFNLVRRRGWALLAPLFLLGLGNFDAVRRCAGRGGFQGTDWWFEMFAHGSRDVIPGTIHEFPSFSFLLGDLHPHYMFMPFCFLILSLLLVFLLRARDLFSRPAPGGLAGAAALFSLALGSVFMFNTWEYPTYVLLATLAALAVLRRREEGGPLRPLPFRLLLVLAASVLLFLPFRLRFEPAAKPSAGFVGAAHRSPLGAFLTVNGLACFAIASFLASESVRLARRGRRVGRAACAVAASAAAAGALAGSATVGIAAGALLAAALIAFSRAETSPGRLFVLLLCLLSAALFLGCEFLYLKDFYGPSLRRQNTVFKYYFQAWILSSVIFAAGGRFVAEGLGRLSGCAWRAVLALLVAPSLIYPVLGAWHRCHGFRWGARGPVPYLPTLDGAAYIRRQHPAEYRALGWVRGWLPPSAVVLEATGEPYSFHGRVSTFTGRPTVLGWGNQESLWRDWSWKTITERTEAIARIYNATRKRDIMPLLRAYGVEYVYVGTLERKRYSAEGLDAFAGSFPLVYRGRGVLIYRVPGEAPPA